MRKKTSVTFLVFILSSLLFCVLIGLGGFIPALLHVPAIYAILGIPALLLLIFLVLQLIRIPRKQTGWSIACSDVKKKRKPGWNETLGYAGLTLALAGMLGILGGAGYGSTLGRKQTLTLTEGETRQLLSQPRDSLHLYKFRLTFHPESQSINNYKAFVITFVDSAFTWDTASLNDPVRTGNRRIYITDYGMSKDSLYLLFRLVLPWGDTIPYEFPPQGVIDDPRFPLIISFEKFHIDRTQLWPNPEVPEVSIKLMLPGELIVAERLRAPDSVNLENYTLHFDGIRMRPTVTFFCVKDISWIIATIGAGLLIVGLILGFVSRIKDRWSDV